MTFGGGCRWKEVDEACAAHGLATIGGTVNHTGVGGLVLGGGYGWMSGQHGLAIDLLISVEMVLADGRIVTASETENPDLFWAVRGAGQQFGVSKDYYPQDYRLNQRHRQIDVLIRQLQTSHHEPTSKATSGPAPSSSPLTKSPKSSPLQTTSTKTTPAKKACSSPSLAAFPKSPCPASSASSASTAPKKKAKHSSSPYWTLAPSPT